MTTLMALTTCDYDSTMGVGVLDASPILKRARGLPRCRPPPPTWRRPIPSCGYLMEPGAKRPDPEAIVTNRFAGKIKLGTPEWNDVRARVSEFDKYLS